MSPVYQIEDGTWWFGEDDTAMGPYATEAIATQAYHAYQKTNCPSCEE